MARILALDYGTKRTGIAATDPLQIIVNPLTVVETPGLMDFLENYLNTEDVCKIVIGQGVHPDGSEYYFEGEIKELINKLNRKFPEIETDRQDESLTSSESREIIMKSGIKKKKRRDKSLIDKISAVLILQRYLKHF
jgi:putative Holliday junction resolvase